MENVPPAKHDIQFDVPSALANVPAGHSAHSLLPVKAAKVPTAHAEQNDDRVAVPKEPAGHQGHSLAPDCELNLLAAQAGQAKAPCKFEKVPGAQLRQELALNEGIKVPGAHGKHSD